LQRFAYDLFGREQANVEAYGSVAEFNRQYRISPTQWERFVSRVAASNLLPDAAQRERIRPWIETAIKAQVARQAWKNEGFYPVFHGLDPEFQKAYELLRSGEARQLIQ
jgi:hypothetical protein